MTGDLTHMQKLLVIDDEEPMRRLLRVNLSDTYEVIDTGDPEQGLALAMQNKPSAILLDLRMPRFSGFELCRTFTALTSTQLTPVFIISGEAGSTTKSLCKELGATAYFEKPIDFDLLRSRLAEVLNAKRPERRSEVRVSLRAPLKLSGIDSHGGSFEECTHTENVSLHAFLCGCAASLNSNSVVNVFLLSGGEQLVGTARVIRSESTETPYPRYAFRFIEKSGQWVLQ
jgi:twitching motility two-component system response regulator PilG